MLTLHSLELVQSNIYFNLTKEISFIQNQTEFSRIEQISVVKFLVTQKGK